MIVSNFPRPGGSSGGGEAFVINLTYDPTSPGWYSADKTYAEIVAAVGQGVIPVVKYSMPNDTTFGYYPFGGIFTDSEEGAIATFSGYALYRPVYGDEDGPLSIKDVVYFVRSNDTWGTIMS